MLSRLRSLSVHNSDWITYAAVLNTKYPKKLAKAFLMELSGLLLEKMQSEFGSSGVDLRSRLETIEQPYYFINFGGFLFTETRLSRSRSKSLVTQKVTRTSTVSIMTCTRSRTRWLRALSSCSTRKRRSAVSSSDGRDLRESFSTEDWLEEIQW